MHSAREIGTIAIVGAGPGSFRLVANTGRAGYRLRLHDIDDAKLAATRARWRHCSLTGKLSC